MKTKYPKLSCELNRVIKICKEEYPAIKQLRKNGMFYIDIAKKYGVSRSTIQRICNPKRAKENERRRREKHGSRYWNDPEYRKKMIESAKRSVTRRIAKDPNYRKWRSESQKEYQKTYKKKK